MYNFLESLFFKDLSLVTPFGVYNFLEKSLLVYNFLEELVYRIK